MTGAEAWKEEAFAAFLVSLERQKIAERKRLAERGEVLIELVLAEGEPPPNSGVIQAEFSGVSAALRAEDVTFTQPIATFDDLHTVGYALPEYVVVLKALGPVATLAIGGIAGAWVQAHLGRKVRLSGAVEGEGESPREIAGLFEAAHEFNARGTAASEAEALREEATARDLGAETDKPSGDAAHRLHTSDGLDGPKAQ